MSHAKESIVKTATYPVWAGSSSDLLRLLSLASSQVLEGRSDFNQEVIAKAKDQIASAERNLEEASERDIDSDPKGPDIDSDPKGSELTALLKKQRRLMARSNASALDWAQRTLEKQEAKAHAVRFLRLKMTGDGESRKTRGTPEELVDYLERRSFNYLEVQAPSDFEREMEQDVTLEMSKRDGISLRISSTNEQWVTATYTFLNDELKKGVPNWRFVRHIMTMAAVFGTGFAFAIYWIFDLIAKLTIPGGKYPLEVGSFMWALLVIFSLFCTNFAIRFTNRKVPAFDLYPDGGKSRGGALVGWFGSIVVALMVGIIGSAIFKGLGG